MNGKSVHTWKQWLFLIFLFFIVSLGTYIYFWFSNSLFTGRTEDIFGQFNIFKQFLHDSYREGEFFWSWEYGLGGDLFGAFNYYYSTSVFFLISLLIPLKSFMALLSFNMLLAIIKMMLAMIFMYILVQSHQHSRFSSVIAAIVYVGSSNFAYYSVFFNYMTDAYVWLPMVIYGLEKMADGKGKGLFIFGVFLICFSNFYFAFISSVFVMVYAAFYYVMKNKNSSWKQFISYYWMVVRNYLIAIAASAVAFLPAVYHFLNADRFEKDIKIEPFFADSFYQNLFYNSFFYTNKLTFPVIALIALFIAWKIKDRFTQWRFLFFVMWIFLYLFPITSMFFNGMSHPQLRWTYLLVFSIAVLVPGVIDTIMKNPVRFRKVLLGSVLVTAFIFILKPYLTGREPVTYEWVNVVIFFMLAIIFIVKLGSPWKKFFITILVIANVFNNSMVLFDIYLGPVEEQKEQNEKIYGENGIDRDELKEMIYFIKERDPGWYRIAWDNLGVYNAPMMLSFNGLSAYHSLIPYNVSKFFRQYYNTYQFDSPSKFKNVDRRTYLEAYLGTKYYIVPEDVNFNPYGFEKITSMNGFTIYENKHAMPIGTLFTEGMTINEFNKLNFSQRDRQLLKGVVTEDKPENHQLKLLDSKDLEGYVLTKGISDDFVLNNVRQNDEFFEFGKGGSLEIPVDITKEDGEWLVKIEVKQSDGKEFELKVNERMVKKRADEDIYSYPQETFVLNLTALRNEGNIKIQLTPGEYVIRDISVTFTPLNNFQKNLAKRNRLAYRPKLLSNGNMKGGIVADEAGVLATSIPYSIGWSAKVDGKVVDVFEVNQAFVGIDLPSGEHEVEFKYRSPWFREGLTLSVLVVLGVLVGNFYRRRKK